MRGNTVFRGAAVTSTASLRRPGRRLLAHLRAGDAEAAEREMNAHLRVLHHMWRLVIPVAAGGPARPPGDGNLA